MSRPNPSQSFDAPPETVAAATVPETSPATAERVAPPTLPRQLGHYELLELIGEGGMGQVYRARHTKLQRDVAVKIIHGASATSLARFSQEMAAAGRIDTPRIVRTTDAGEADGVPFLVMEFIEGVAIDALVRRRGPLSVSDSCEVARQAAEGVAHLESLHMAHRDLKPGNLILDRAGQVKILDLGLAKLAREGAGDLTRGVVIGTLDFMAPEQARDSATADIRADIYSLGATLYFLLTGETPLRCRGDVLARLQAIATELPIPIRERRPDVPEALSRIVERLLAKDPNDRPATGAEVVELLQPFAKDADLTSLVVPDAQGLASTCTLSSPARLSPSPAAWSARHARNAAVVVACLLGLLGAAYGLIVKLKTRAGEILVEVEQPGATILVDDQEELLVTSAEKQVYRISAAPGQHKLKVRFPSGNSVLSTDVQVEAGQKTPLFRASLVRDPTLATKAESGSATPEKSATRSQSPRESKLLTVAQDGSGDCRSINEALQAIAAEGMIRILDNSEYREQLNIDSNLRHAGLTIESPRGATVVGTQPQSNVIFVSAPRVTLRGLSIRSEAVPTILCCVGLNAAGVQLDNLDFQATKGQIIQGLSLEQLQTGDPPNPVLVHRCRFRSCATALRVSGLEKDYRTATPCSGVAIIDNQFEANAVGLRCVGDVRNLVAAGNRFIDSSVFAVQLEQLRGEPRNIWLLNNTLCANRFGFRVWDEKVVKADIHVLNNLTVQSTGLDWAGFDNGGSPETPRGPLNAALIHERWQVRGNWREGTPPDKNSPLAAFWLRPGEHDHLAPQIPLLARNLNQADFLRPAADSPLAIRADTSAHRELPKYVGALPPPGMDGFDWLPLVKKLLSGAPN